MRVAPLLAVVELVNGRLAFDAALVDQVIAAPTTLVPIPGAPALVRGMVRLREAPIPVIDVNGLLHGGTTQSSRDTSLLMVLRLPEGRCAVPIVQIIANVRPVDGELAPVVQPRATQALVCSRVYTPQGSDDMIPVVDLAAIEGLDELVLTGFGTAAAAQVMVTHVDRRPALPHLIVRAGSLSFAIEASTVRHIEAARDVDSLMMDHPILRGFHQYRGDQLAVIDLLALLGQSSTAAVQSPRTLVSIGRSDSTACLLLVDNMVAIESISPRQLSPTSLDGFDQAQTIAGSYVRGESEVVLVLASDELLRAADIVDRGSLFAQADAEAAQRRATDSSEQFMVYRIGKALLASRLSQVDAVVTLPTDFTDLRREPTGEAGGEAGGALVGTFSRLGQPIVLLDLGVLLGMPPMETVAERPVLIVSGAHGTQGFLVEHLAFLRRDTPTRLNLRNVDARGGIPPIDGMIQAHIDGANRSASILDLVGIASAGPPRPPRLHRAA